MFLKLENKSHGAVNFVIGWSCIYFYMMPLLSFDTGSKNNNTAL